MNPYCFRGSRGVRRVYGSCGRYQTCTAERDTGGHCYLAKEVEPETSSQN